MNREREIERERERWLFAHYFKKSTPYANCVCGQDSTRTLNRTKTGKERKSYLLCNFRPEQLTLQFDSGLWQRVRCVKLTHSAGEVIEEGNMESVLQQRMAAYIDVAADEGEEEIQPGLHHEGDDPAEEGLAGRPDHQFQVLCDGEMMEQEDRQLDDHHGGQTDEESDAPFEPSADDWEVLLSREDADDLPVNRPLFPVRLPSAVGQAASSSSSSATLPPNSWATPQDERKLVAPGSRIQRRMPTRCFQVHFKLRSGQSISKAFSWCADPDGKPTMQEQLEAAISWSWDQFEKDV